MNVADVLKLVEAGFTAQQISQMLAAPEPEKPAPAEEKPAPAPEPEKAAPEPKAAEASLDDIYKKLSDQIDSKFAEMAETFKMPANPSIQDIKPLGLDDIIRNFFKEE